MRLLFETGMASTLRTMLGGIWAAVCNNCAAVHLFLSLEIRSQGRKQRTECGINYKVHKKTMHQPNKKHIH